MTSLESEGVYASQGLDDRGVRRGQGRPAARVDVPRRGVGRRGIRVNTVALGFIETPMTAAAIQASGTRLREQTALGRTGRPADLGPPVVFLSVGASYITGETLNVGGGMGLGATIRLD